MAGRGRWAAWLSSWAAWHWTLGAAQEPECVDLQTNCATLVASGYTCSMNLHSLIPSFPEGSLLCGVCPVTCGACGHGCTEALGLPPGTPEPEPDSICGGPQAPWSTPVPGGGGAACACVTGYWSPAGHGHDCQQVLRCTATQYQSLPPSPTSNAHCLPLTTCRPDEVQTTAPTATSDRVCTGVWEQVEDSTMGDPTCWNVETGFVYARCCNTEHSAVGDGSCWEGDFTFERCCAQPPPPPPVPNTIGGGGTATILPNVPPPPPPPPPPPVANCVGAWGECLWHPHVPHANMPEAVASGCLKRYTVITLARGGGEPCPVQDLTWTSCAPGEGRCPKSQLASGGSSKPGVSGSLKSGVSQPAASPPASSGWLWLLLLLALVAGGAVAVRRRGGGGPCVELLTDGSTRRVKWCCCAESKREREESLLAEADALSEFDSRGRERNPLGASVGIAIAS